MSGDQPASRLRPRNRVAILDAARRLVDDKGEAFTTQELIKEAGVALQTFYRILFESSRDSVRVWARGSGPLATGVRLLGGSGKWLGPKSRCAGCEPATLDDRDVPGCPPGPAYLARAASVTSCR